MDKVEDNGRWIFVFLSIDFIKILFYLYIILKFITYLNIITKYK